MPSMPRWTKSSTSRRWADPSCPASAASRSCTRGDCQPIAWRCDDSPRSGRVRHNFDLRPAHRASSAPVESETRAILGITGLVGRGEGHVEENEFSFCVQSGGSVLSRISFHWPIVSCGPDFISSASQPTRAPGRALSGACAFVRAWWNSIARHSLDVPSRWAQMQKMNAGRC